MERGVELKVSLDHKLFCKGDVWKKVEDLDLGDLVKHSEGSLVEIKSIKITGESVLMYDIHVDSEFSGFIAEGIVVHNSKMAEHQVTLGDDKIVTQNGSKISAGKSLPGVRQINVTGAMPTIMPGRDGSQYLATVESNIKEMYEVADLQELLQQEKGQQDPIISLFKAAKTKRRFGRNIARFNQLCACWVVILPNKKTLNCN